MGVLNWIGGLIAALWRFSRRSWIDTGMGLRPGSGASALVLFLFLIFFLVGLVLVLIGFDLADVDRWLEAQGGWIEAIGDLLFRAVCGGILLVCLFLIGGAIFDRGNKDRPGFGCAFLAAVVAYFAWFGVTGD